MPNTVTYPFDPTGLAATNLVANEQHTLTSVNSTTYRLIIPKFAPFHVNNFKMVHITMDGVETPLAEGVDFNFVFLYLGASRSIGTAVYGGITLLNELVDGYIKIKRYQTLGGEWCCDQQYVLSLLADIVFNPRTVPWEKLTNVQQVFPPINHDQAMDWIKGHDDLIQAVNALADIIANGGQLREQNLSLLIRNMVMTPAQVGLGDVQNLPLATSAEVNAALPANKYITLAQAVSLLNNQIANLNQAGVDYVGLDSRNIYTMTQVLSRNTAFVEPSLTGTQWDVATNQNFRVKLTSNLSNFDIIGLDQWTLGAEVRMTVLNQGGDIVWPPNVLFSGGIVPTLTLTPGKYDILTFTVESSDGSNYFLLNTDFKGNL